PLMKASAASGICHLIMIFQVINKYCRIQSESRRSTPLLLPVISLSLKEEAILCGGDEFLGRATVVLIIGFFAAGQGYQRAVMKVIVPYCVEPVSTCFSRTHQSRMLRLIFGYNDCGAVFACPASGLANCSKD